MSLPIDILNLLAVRLRAMRLTDDSATLLFERVEIYVAKSIEEAYQRLYLTEARTCLIVPLGLIRRPGEPADNLVKKHLEVTLLYAVRGYGLMETLIGSDATPGLIDIAERAESLLLAEGELSSYGLPVFGDGLPLLGEKDDAERIAWEQALSIPVGGTVSDY